MTIWCRYLCYIYDIQHYSICVVINMGTVSNTANFFFPEDNCRSILFFLIIERDKKKKKKKKGREFLHLPRYPCCWIK
jgi:hypothetical protein